jgi:hypothetical protein
MIPNVGVLGVAMTHSLALAAVGPRMKVTRQNTNLVLTFQGRLQQASEANGPFTNVVGAVSPFVTGQSELGDYWRSVMGGAKTIAGSGRHTVALREEGTLWTWGHNNYGQLGAGTTNNASTPQPIQPNERLQAVAAGGTYLVGHTVAWRADGTLWARGYNRYGQSGNGTTDDGNTPQPVLGGAGWGTPR